MSDTEIDGSIFVPKGGYCLLILVKVYLRKLAFSQFCSHFYDLTFRQNVGYFTQEIHLCPCFWLFWSLYFHNFPQILFERSLYSLKRHRKLP